MREIKMQEVKEAYEWEKMNEPIYNNRRDSYYDDLLDAVDGDVDAIDNID